MVKLRAKKSEHQLWFHSPMSNSEFPRTFQLLSPRSRIMEQDTHPFCRGPEDLQNTSQKTLPHCETRCSLCKLQNDTKHKLVIPCHAP